MSPPAGARLLARLRTAGLDIPKGAIIRQTRAGRHQIAAGAYRWQVETEDGKPLPIGSDLTVAELLTAPRITWVISENGVIVAVHRLEHIPSGWRRLSRLTPEFVMWAGEWALIGPDWTLPEGGSVQVERFREFDTVTVKVGAHIAERTVARRSDSNLDGPPTVRYVIARIDRERDLT